MRTAILFSYLFLASLAAFSQNDSLPPYLKVRTIPQFKIMATDSSWITKANLKKGKNTIIMLFSPDCEHCQKQTEILLENMDKLNHTQIVMTTTLQLDKIRDFVAKYKLDKYPNILVGRDPNLFFGIFYDLKYTPFLAIYDKKEDLLKAFDGGAKWNKLEEVLK